MTATDFLILGFVFALGACVGSFLNVVVYRLPLGKSLVHPPSACPNCGHKLAAYDNVPIFGWLWLGGKCRYCADPISARYPLVELITGLLFVGQYLMLFHFGWGPYGQTESIDVFGISQTTFNFLTLERDWPVLLLHLWLISALLAASLIDWEHFIIPLGLCWVTALFGVVIHAALLPPGSLGGLHFSPTIDALTVGAAVGWGISLLLLKAGLIKRSFADDEPLMEKDIVALPEDQRPDPWPPSRIRQEMRLEILFLAPPLLLGTLAFLAVLQWPAVASAWSAIADQPNVSGALGALCGGMVGAFVVWLFRIAGSYGFGREAMGLGDVHLMLGVGAIIGPGAATVAFFLAPAFGLLVAVLSFFLKGRREIPYGPYLSMGSVLVMLCYPPIYHYLRPGVEGLVLVMREYSTAVIVIVSLACVALVLQGVLAQRAAGKSS